jgi:hypothetical protein
LEKNRFIGESTVRDKTHDFDYTWEIKLYDDRKEEFMLVFNDDPKLMPFYFNKWLMRLLDIFLLGWV